MGIMSIYGDLGFKSCSLPYPMIPLRPLLPEGRMAYIDPLNGNDATGQFGYADLPFVTAAAAIAALPAGTQGAPVGLYLRNTQPLVLVNDGYDARRHTPPQRLLLRLRTWR